MPAAEAAPSAPPPDDLDALPLPEAKARLRARMKALRAGRADPAAALALRDRLLDGPPLPDGPVCGFWPLRDEVDVRPALEALAARGRACALPVVRGRGLPLLFRRWAPGDRLVPRGPFGIAEPGEDAPEVAPRVLLVPLLAFDRRGGRLGYGAGFYDRTLARLRAAGPVLAVGVAMSWQEVASVPCDGLDQRMDRIVTEAGTIEIPEA